MSSEAGVIGEVGDNLPSRGGGVVFEEGDNDLLRFSSS